MVIGKYCLAGRALFAYLKDILYLLWFVDTHDGG